jgi:type I restriction enzyme R subunit
MKKEAKARLKINKFLEEAGWRLLDNSDGKANVIVEGNVHIEGVAEDNIGDDYEYVYRGYIDYLLLDENNYPLCVLEAKSESRNPLDGKEQARRYANNKKVRFIILSNGNLHYFWDLTCGNPTVISTFPTPESIKHFESFKPNPTNLVDVEVTDDYISLTQMPEYKTDPRWNDETQRKSFIEEKGLKFLRPYQLNAISALQGSVRNGNNRFLFEMATGTGKTLVSAAVIKLFLKTGNATRILFLVDRLELEDQAYKNFVRYLKNDYTCVIFKKNRDDWHHAEIVVSTVQTLSINNKYKELFSPTDFDLIISDEAHRSISGNSRAVFEYFVGYKLGLTATPKDYLKNIDPEKLSQNDVRAWERRQLLDTYKTFGCESVEPTFRYSLIEGVRDDWLVNPVVADARTEITTQLLSDRGYSIMVENEDGTEEEQIFFLRDFERKFFSEKTNRIFCKTFLENALKDPVSGEIGKTIIFCVSQDHASKISQILNEYAHQIWQGKYNSDFAMQITSRIPESQQFTINFANNNLGGHTQFLEGYKSSKVRVCVTVGMMTTGYDCEDILNLCLMRPIFSPTDFIQIKGRGTRKFTFLPVSRNQAELQEGKVEKDKYKLFDFFANCEYFEERYNYDEIIELPPETGGEGPGGDGPTVADEITVVIPDPLKTFTETEIGPQGMKVDRKLFENFESTVKEDPFIKENFEKGNIDAVEEYVKKEVFDKPEEYFNLAKLRKSIQSDRRISLRDFLEKIFGLISRFKDKDEVLNDEYEKFILINKPDSEYIIVCRNYFKSYVTDSSFREIVDHKDYTRLNNYPGFTMAEFKQLNIWRDKIPEYIKDYVNINKFI